MSSAAYYRPQGKVMFSQVSVCRQLVSWLISTNGDGYGFPNGFLYYAGFSTGTETDSNPLIQMYGIGMEICPWDRDPSLKWVS